MDKTSIIVKLTSRKFWLSVAATLAGIGTAIAGLNSGSEKVAMAGALCAALSAAIYAFAEALVDASATEATASSAVATEEAGDE